MAGEKKDDRIDFSAETPEQAAARRRKPWITIGAMGAGVVALLALYVLFTRPPPEPGTGVTLSAKRIFDVMAPVVGRVQTRLASGDLKDSGLAVTLANGQMATTCHNIPRGSMLRVVFRDGTSVGDIALADESSDICVLKVKTTGSSSAKLRVGDPAVGEKVYAAFVGADSGTGHLSEGHVTGTILEPAGTVLQLDFTEPLATGTPIVDTQGRVAGIAVMPHRYGAGNVAFSASRISRVRDSAKR